MTYNYKQVLEKLTTELRTIYIGEKDILTLKDMFTLIDGLNGHVEFGMRSHSYLDYWVKTSNKSFTICLADTEKEYKNKKKSYVLYAIAKQLAIIILSGRYLIDDEVWNCVPKHIKIDGLSCNNVGSLIEPNEMHYFAGALLLSKERYEEQMNLIQKGNSVDIHKLAILLESDYDTVYRRGCDLGYFE